MRTVADALAASALPLDEDALASRFTSRWPWKKRAADPGDAGGARQGAAGDRGALARGL